MRPHGRAACFARFGETLIRFVQFSDSVASDDPATVGDEMTSRQRPVVDAEDLGSLSSDTDDEACLSSTPSAGRWWSSHAADRDSTADEDEERDSGGEEEATGVVALFFASDSKAAPPESDSKAAPPESDRDSDSDSDGGAVSDTTSQTDGRPAVVATPHVAGHSTAVAEVLSSPVLRSCFHAREKAVPHLAARILANALQRQMWHLFIGPPEDGKSTLLRRVCAMARARARHTNLFVLNSFVLAFPPPDPSECCVHEILGLGCANAAEWARFRDSLDRYCDNCLWFIDDMEFISRWRTAPAAVTDFFAETRLANRRRRCQVTVICAGDWMVNDMDLGPIALVRTPPFSELQIASLLQHAGVLHQWAPTVRELTRGHRKHVLLAVAAIAATQTPDAQHMENVREHGGRWRSLLVRTVAECPLVRHVLDNFVHGETERCALLLDVLLQIDVGSSNKATVQHACRALLCAGLYTVQGPRLLQCRTLSPLTEMVADCLVTREQG